jgi:hypothetical protein
VHDASPGPDIACADLTTFCRLDELGLEVTGQRLDPDRAVLACRVVEPDQRCRRCGCEGAPRDTILRRLAHEPFGWRPTTLHVTVRRYRCSGCGDVWRQDTSRAAEPRTKLSRRGLRWALEGIVVQHQERSGFDCGDCGDAGHVVLLAPAAISPIKKRTGPVAEM